MSCGFSEKEESVSENKGEVDKCTLVFISWLTGQFVSCFCFLKSAPHVSISTLELKCIGILSADETVEHALLILLWFS